MNIINALSSMFNPKTLPQVDNSSGLLPLEVGLEGLCGSLGQTSEQLTRAEQTIIAHTLSNGLQSSPMSSATNFARKKEEDHKKENYNKENYNRENFFNEAQKLREEVVFFESLETFLVKNSAFLAQAKELREKDPEKYLAILENKVDPKIALFIDTLLGLGYDTNPTLSDGSFPLVSGSRCFPDLINKWRMQKEKEIGKVERNLSDILTSPLQVLGSKVLQLNFNIPMLSRVVKEMPKADWSTHNLAGRDCCTIVHDRIWYSIIRGKSEKSTYLGPNFETKLKPESPCYDNLLSLEMDNMTMFIRAFRMFKESPNTYVQHLTQFIPNQNIARSVDGLLDLGREADERVPESIAKWRKETDAHIEPLMPMMSFVNSLADKIMEKQDPNNQDFSLPLSMAKKIASDSAGQKDKSLTDIIRAIQSNLEEEPNKGSRAAPNIDQLNLLMNQSVCCKNMMELVSANPKDFNELVVLAQKNPKGYVEVLNSVDKQAARIIDQLVIAFLKTPITESPELAQWRGQRPMQPVRIIEGKGPVVRPQVKRFTEFDEL
jgi:hypothetical protein